LHPFNNKPDVVKILAILLTGFLIFLFWPDESKAEDVYVEAGPTVLSGEYSEGMAVMVSGVWDDRWLLGFGVVGNQVCKCNEGEIAVGNNLMVQAQLLVRGPDVFFLRHTQMGIGPAYFQEKNRALGRNLTVGLMVAVARPEHWWKWLPQDLVVRHYSNAGSGTPNMGQDVYPMLRWVRSF
jgi:hypothetical protein